MATNAAKTSDRHGGSAWLRIAIVAVFVGALAAFFALGGQKYLSLDAVKSNRDALLAATRDHYALAVVVAFVVYTAVVACSIPGAGVLTLLTGFLFGRWVGSCAAGVSVHVIAARARAMPANEPRPQLRITLQNCMMPFSADHLTFNNDGCAMQEAHHAARSRTSELRRWPALSVLVECRCPAPSQCAN